MRTPLAERETIEIRLHGRGGQGTVTMAALLADAAYRSGWHVMGFPAFGTERTGAPVAAFIRLSKSTIRDRGEVRTPSVVVVADPSVASSVDVLNGLTDDGMVIVNVNAPPGASCVVNVPVNDLAIEHLGSAITSTAMLAVFGAATKLIGIEEICAAIVDRFGDKAGANIALARAAYERANRRKAA